MDLPRQIHEGTPYPVKALFAMGLNYRILPDDQYFKSAMEKLDFFVDADLFMTDAAKMADIVLPVCTSYERGELETYPGVYAWLTKPAIDRVGESKSDAEILCDLAKVMNLGDKRLEEGYEKNIEEILSNLDITMEELRSSDLPVKVRGVKPYVPGTILEKGCKTPTGKFELYSETVYPFILCSGGRLPNAIHSRLHKVPWVRSLRPDPMADISIEDAQALGLKEGDDIELFTERGTISVKAHPTH